MHTRYEVRDGAGKILGIFPEPLKTHVEAIRALVAEHPGATVTPRTSPTRPCVDHTRFEDGNCPACGTAQTIQPRRP